MTIGIHRNQNEGLETAQKLKAQFIALVNQNQKNYYKMGMILNRLKSILSDEEFNDFIDGSLSYSYSNLNKYMKIASEYKEETAIILGVKKAYLLLKINKDVRDSFIKEHQAHLRTFDELEELVNEHNSITIKKRKVSERTVIKKLSKITDDAFKNISAMYTEDKEMPENRKEIMKKLQELKELIKQLEIESCSEESNNSVQNNETQEHDKEDPVTVEEINGEKYLTF